MSRLSFAMKYAAVGILAWGAVVLVTSAQQPKAWHTIFDNCPAGASVGYAGASTDGAILFRGPGGCLELWTTR